MLRPWIPCLALLALLGCPPPEEVPDEAAELRVLHLSPDAPEVDIYVDEEGPVVTGLAFGEGTDYLEVEAGTVTVHIVPSGDDLEEAVLVLDDLTLEEDTRYAAVAYDTVDDLAALALEDDDTGIEEGDLRLRVGHAAVDVGAVDLWELTGPTLLIEGLDFGETDVLDVGAGPLSVGLDLDGDGAPDLTFDVPDLGDEVLVNVFAVTDEVGPHLLAHLPDGSTARIDPIAPEEVGARVIHLSPDAPEVDVFVDEGDDPVVSDLAFLEGTTYLSLDPGTYSFQVAPTGDAAEDAVLEVEDLTLEGGTDYSVVAYGFLDEIAALALVDDPSGLEAGSVRLQVSHVADGVETVDLLAGEAVLIEGLAYGETESLDVASGALDLGLDVGQDGTVDFTFSVPDLGADHLVNVFAVLDAEGPFLVAHLPDGTVTAPIRPDEE